MIIKLDFEGETIYFEKAEILLKFYRIKIFFLKSLFSSNKFSTEFVLSKRSVEEFKSLVSELKKGLNFEFISIDGLLGILSL